MRSKLTSLLAVIGAATILVLAANTVALATTGKALLAGKTNTSTKATALSRTTPGTALVVKTKSSANSPFAVNGTGKVANLNADRLDGLDSTQLGANTYLWTKSISSAVSSISVFVPLPVGTYKIGYDARLVDGGTAGGSARCYFFKTPAAGTNTFYAWTRVPTQNTLDGQDPALSGEGIVTLGAGDTLKYYCTSSTSFTTGPEQPIQVWATKTKLVGTGTL